MGESYQDSVADEPNTVNGTYYPNIKHAFILFLVLVLSQLIAGIPSIIVQQTTSWPTPPLNTLSLIISFVLVLLFLHNRRGHSNFSFKRIPVLAYIPLILLALIMPVLLEPAVSLIPMPDWIVEVFKELIGKDVFSFLSIVIIAPIFEELIFRGAILRGFLKNYSPQKAILWSSFFFGLAHMNPWQFIGAFFAGMLLGWVYLKTKSLIPCILIHAVNNGFSFLLMFYVDDIEESFRTLIGSDSKYLILYSCCAVVFVGCIYLLNYLLKKNSH